MKITSLEAVEFLRRFLMHVLPVGFQRLRSYGLLANRHRTASLATCRRLLGCAPPPATAKETPEPEEDGETWAEEAERLTGLDPHHCPACGEGRLRLLEAVPSREDRLCVAPPGTRRRVLATSWCLHVLWQ